MLFTYSFDRARGCRSYQSSTSLSVSNTGNLRIQIVGNSTINAQQTDFCYLMFYFLELPRLGIGNEDRRPIRMRPLPGRCRIDVNMVGCRDLLAEKKFLLSTFPESHSFRTSTIKAASAWSTREIKRRL